MNDEMAKVKEILESMGRTLVAADELVVAIATTPVDMPKVQKCAFNYAQERLKHHELYMAAMVKN